MIRRLADEIGLDPWDLDPIWLAAFLRDGEREPVSRFRLGSPCRFIRSLDAFIHVVLPEMLVEKHPVWACYLRSTSPRWGRSWRGW